MKKGRLQCKDIPDEDILALLRQRPGVGFSWFDIETGMPSVRKAFPPGCPDNLILAKMRQMIHKGVVEGCACGCRGDFRETVKKKREGK